MRRARILLPVLEKIGPVHITDGWWSNPIRNDIPEEFLENVLEMCGFDRSLWEEGYYKREYNISSRKIKYRTIDRRRKCGRKKSIRNSGCC